MKLPPGDPRHGTLNGYTNHGCRCKRCRAANTIYHRESGAQQRYRQRYTKGVCQTPGCGRRRDRAYITGYCHRCNLEQGLKPDRRAKT